MNKSFNEFSWHDSNLQFIYIDRQKPGELDVVKIQIDWPDSHSSTIEFYDCYALNMNMNFGIVACESILTAECITDSEELNSIRKKWIKVNVNLDQLKCYRIVTNSTNSVIDIYALGYQLTN